MQGRLNGSLTSGPTPRVEDKDRAPQVTRMDTCLALFLSAFVIQCEIQIPS